MASIQGKIKIIDTTDANGNPLDGSLITSGGIYATKSIICNGILSTNDININNKTIYLGNLKSYNSTISIMTDDLLPASVQTGIIKMNNNEIKINDNSSNTIADFKSTGITFNQPLTCSQLSAQTLSLSSAQVPIIKTLNNDLKINDDLSNNLIDITNNTISFAKPISCGQITSTYTFNNDTNSLTTGNIFCNSINSHTYPISSGDITCGAILSSSTFNNGTNSSTTGAIASSNGLTITNNSATTATAYDLITASCPNISSSTSSRTRLKLTDNVAYGSAFSHLKGSSASNRGFALSFMNNSSWKDIINYYYNSGSTDSLTFSSSCFYLLSPSMPNNYTFLQMGKNSSNYNNFSLYYNHLGDSSLSNYLSLNLMGIATPVLAIQKDRLGICMTTPQSTLDVAGSINASSSISCSSSLLTSSSLSVLNSATIGSLTVSSIANSGTMSCGAISCSSSLLTSSSLSVLNSATIGSLAVSSIANSGTMSCNTLSLNGNLNMGTNSIISSGTMSCSSIGIGSSSLTCGSVQSYNGSYLSLPNGIDTVCVKTGNVMSSYNTGISFSPNNGPYWMRIDPSKLTLMGNLDCGTNSATISKLSIGSLTASSSISCTNGSLNGNTLSVSSASASNMSISVSLTCPSISSTSFTATNSTISNLTSAIITCPIINSTTLTTSDFYTNTITNTSANITNLTSSAISSTNLTSTTSNITNLTCGTLNLSNLNYSGNLSGTSFSSTFSTVTATTNVITPCIVSSDLTGYFRLKDYNSYDVLVLNKSNTTFNSDMVNFSYITVGSQIWCNDIRGANITLNGLHMIDNDFGVNVLSSNNLPYYNFNTTRFLCKNNADFQTNSISCGALTCQNINASTYSMTCGSVICSSSISSPSISVTNLTCGALSSQAINASTYSLTSGNITCQAINAGTYNLTCGNITCQAINAGTYGINDGNITCKAINSGTNSLTTGDIICQNITSSTTGKLFATINTLSGIGNNTYLTLATTNVYYGGWFSAAMLNGNKFKNTTGVSQYWNISYSFMINAAAGVSTSYDAFLQKEGLGQTYGECMFYKTVAGSQVCLNGSSLIKMDANDMVYLMIYFSGSSGNTINGGTLTIHQVV